jgi:oxaloacetate decarboxylase gamma subunit
MNELYSQALVLFGVGMVTIFVILALVVISGNLLIRLVNRYFPLAAPIASPASPSSSEVSPKILAAIVASVEVLTAGKGRIVDIQRPPPSS